MSHPTRRAVHRTTATLATTAACHSRASATVPAGAPPAGAPREGQFRLPSGATMPMRTLGATGERVSLLGLGGYHIGVQCEQSESVRIIRTAIDHGVTFLDNCWDYNDGASEQRMGDALRDGYRNRVFVMTKIDGRTRECAAQQLEQSLRRLQTDHVDLVQIHEVIRMNDAERVFAPGGTIEALVAARAAGKVRYIGFTGHKDPAIHLHMLEAARTNNFRFDTVQMPLNVMDPHHRSFERAVLPVLQRENIGVLGMKPLGSGAALRAGVVNAIECLHYAMNLATSVVITGCDTMGVLEQALFAAMTFRPIAAHEVRELLTRTATAGSDGRFEPFKTTGAFDGTAQHPQWLETATLRA